MPSSSHASRAVSAARTFGLVRRASIFTPSFFSALPAARDCRSPFLVSGRSASGEPSAASPCLSSHSTARTLDQGSPHFTPRLRAVHTKFPRLPESGLDITHIKRGRRAPMTATTDIHFHILPGVDDGPRTMADSLDLAAAAVRDGCRTVVATPHVRSDFITDVSDLPDRVREVQAEIDHAGIPLGIDRGAELGHDMVGRLLQEELDAIALGPPGARWLLVETPFHGIDDDFTAATEELRDRGFGVVLAHPERAAGVLEGGGAAVKHQIAQGSALQVNASSLAGRHGGEARRAAVRLLLDKHATVLGSDAHSLARGPALTQGLEHAVRIGLEPAAAAALVAWAPRALLARGLPTRPLRVAA